MKENKLASRNDLSARRNIDSFLQFALFLKNKHDLYYCDEAGREFLDTVGAEAILPHVELLELNTTVSSTTILIENNSYNLRMIPIGSEKESNEASGEYIIILQSQTLFSALVKEMELTDFTYDTETLDRIFANVNNGIFIVDTNNRVRYANHTYERITGLNRNSLMRNIYDLEREGILSTLISPTILETHDDFAAFQTLGGKRAIISGSIVCRKSGEPVCTLTCPNIITASPTVFTDKRLLNSPTRPASHLLKAQIDIIAESDEMRAVIADVLRVAHYDVPVLILGESGTGKEVIANLLHSSSRGQAGQFVKINCSALTPSLLETELFGYEPGAFTGALARGKKGLFEEANNGTILLDEIGDMPLESQVKLLRVLQEGELNRVGGTKPIKVNARIIAATNRNLSEMTEKQLFRKDLFHRLNVIPITIPPLRERRRDIIPLILHYSYFFNKKYGVKKTFSGELLQVMSQYDWPGNVRELRNVVERLMLICTSEILLPEHFYTKYSNSNKIYPFSEIPTSSSTVMPLKKAVSIVERELIEQAIRVGKNSRNAAKLLEISQATLVRKAAEYHIPLRKDSQQS